MYLSSVKLWNFRKFGGVSPEIDTDKPDIEIPLNQGLNVLVGENDSGKTAIIDAIKIVLDTHSGEWVRLSNDDFHKDCRRLRIECRFDDLSDVEAAHFTEWLGMKEEGDNAKPYLKVILDATKGPTDRLHYDIRAGADDEGSLLPGEAREYLKTTYLKPLRDAKAELVPRKGSRLAQILFGHPAFKDQDKEHVLAKLSRCWDCLFGKYFDKSHKPDDCTESPCHYATDVFPTEERQGEGIQRDLQDMIARFFAGDEYQAEFTVLGHNLKNILEQFKLSLSDDSLGLGSQNLLFIAAELLNLKRGNWTGARLALIEELEAHLHPQAQLRVIAYFEEFVRDNKDVQIILTTHSPNLASKVKLDNLVVCHGGQVYPMKRGLTELKDDDYEFLERFLDVTKANLFFAKGVILVEGWSEELLLPVLAKKIGRDLTQKGISIVNVGSTAFLRYAKIFRRKDGRETNIPVAVITDLDVKPDKESVVRGTTTTKEMVTKRKKGQYDGQTVKTFVAPHWTLEYCLSKSSLASEFERIVKEVHRDIDKGRSFGDGLADKLTQSRLSKPKIASKLAQRIEQQSPAIENDEAIRYLIDAITYVTR